jgi:hypothetical protein
MTRGGVTGAVPDEGPMLLSSILVNASGRIDEAGLGAVIRENVDSLRRHHPGLGHRFFGREEIRQLIRQRFSAEVLGAFDALRPYAYQADLARYCILHEFGGLYADLSYLLLGPLPLDGQRITVFRDFQWSSPWDVSNGLIASPARHPALLKAIEAVCANVARRYYGPTPLCPTGPALFGKALATACDPEQVIAGHALVQERESLARLIPQAMLPAGKRVHVLALGGSLVAIKRKRMGAQGLAELGVADGNAYRDFWVERRVYEDNA